MRNNRKKTGTIHRLAGVFCLSVTLGACAELSNAPPPPPCPPVTTLGDAAIITRFIEGPGRDLIDIDFTGKITHLSGKCTYEYFSDAGDGEVRVNVRPEFRIERGAANKDRSAKFEYFVSILDYQGNILDKQTFPYSANYWKNRQTIIDRDAPVELTIPLNSGQTGRDFNIYVGFQLSREELNYNRGNASQ